MDQSLVWIGLTLLFSFLLCAYAYFCARLNVFRLKGGWIGYPFGYVLLASLAFHFSVKAARAFWSSQFSIWKRGVDVISLGTAGIFLLFIIVVSRMIIPPEGRS